MFAAHATGLDWLAADPQLRRQFVAATCRACSLRGLGEAVPALVVEGIEAVFQIPGLKAAKISTAFGEVFAALVLLGDYHEHLNEVAARTRRYSAALN